MHTPDHANPERINVYATTDRGGRIGTAERYRGADETTPAPWHAFTDAGRHIGTFPTSDQAAAALAADRRVCA